MRLSDYGYTFWDISAPVYPPVQLKLKEIKKENYNRINTSGLQIRYHGFPIAELTKIKRSHPYIILRYSFEIQLGINIDDIYIKDPDEEFFISDISPKQTIKEALAILDERVIHETR